MAQKVEITLVDDLDGTEAVETTAFGFNGTSYEIDLNKKNADKLRRALEPFVASARKVGSAPKRRGSSSTGEAKKIREWAQGQGMDVPDRGKLPQSVRDAYAAAH